MANRKKVYAILRYDEFQDESVPIENRVTVTRVLLDEATARTEVQRLGELNAGKGCRYFWQATRIEETTNGS